EPGSSPHHASLRSFANGTCVTLVAILDGPMYPGRRVLALHYPSHPGVYGSTPSSGSARGPPALAPGVCGSSPGLLAHADTCSGSLLPPAVLARAALLAPQYVYREGRPLLG